MTQGSGEILGWLRGRRWFAGKDRRPRSLKILDSSTIDATTAPALDIALAQVDFADGGHDRYLLLLTVDEGGSSSDAFDSIERLGVLGDLMAHGGTAPGSFGAFHFGGPGLDPSSPPGARSVTPLDAEQSNSSVIFDDQVILKLFRRPDFGPNPDLQLNRYLTAAGFEHVPAQVGEIVYEGVLGGGEVTMDLGLAQSYLKGDDGWAKMLSEVRSLLEPPGLSGDDAQLRAAVEERGRKGLEELEELGDVTASMHVTLSREELDPEIAPETIRAADLNAWANDVGASLRELQARGISPDELHSGELEARLEIFRRLQVAGSKTRVHGDLHLGQVLYTPRGWMLLDFEGEPLRALEARRAKQSPLRDVAGMLRSFSYAASAGLFHLAAPDTSEWLGLQPVADAWESLARQRYLGAYLRKSHEARYLPDDRETIGSMLSVFEIEKALYEVSYEEGHRPEWVRVPLRGLDRIVREARSHASS
jgi:maltokinase